MKKFKTESQRVLDLMINSIYTHKEIFIRELLSNASDAIDKLYYKSLTDGISGLSREDFYIEIEVDKPNRILKISDNGIGMSLEELENNLGVIAKSGSLDFKKDNEAKEDINIIGQFGVGFYSAFMVSDKVEVLSKAYGSEEANLWVSKGAEGYDVKKAEKKGHGTSITMYLKQNTDDDSFDAFLEEYKIKELVKRYSDYIRYPIKMEITKYKEEDGKQIDYKEKETLNSMIPLWKKNKSQIKKEEYDEFYKNVFYDTEEPLTVIHTSAEGAVDYKALLFIPAHPQYNYYTKNFEKGLRLYTNGVLITEQCKDLLPDYFSFVKGLVDSELTLNISRETIQHNRQLKLIAANLEKKIKAELTNLLLNDREKYIKFFEGFGPQLKYGLYENWGMNKEMLQDLIIFHSVKEDKMVTLSEYVDKMAEGQKYIYYASGKTVEAIKTLPQSEKVLEIGYDILCFTEDMDEFAIKFLYNYREKEFRSIAGEDLGIEEKDFGSVDNPELIAFIKETLKDKIEDVKLTKFLKTHPVCLSSKGDVSIEMERVLSGMPNAPKEGVKAQKVLEINANHAIYEKLIKYYTEDKDKAGKLIEVLYSQALMIAGMPINNPTALTDIICQLV